jgi:hypothetical protein
MRLPPVARHQGARRGLIAALALVALASVGCAQRADDAAAAASQTSAPKTVEAGCKNSDAAQAARDFYAKVLADAPSGLPSSASMLKLAPLMSASMRAAVEKARIRQQASIAAHPDEKPDFIEGSLFTSLFEGPTALESATAVANGDSAVVEVGFVYAQAGAETLRWKDQALLRCEEQRWRLDDVRYGGDWDFAPKGQLKQALESE